jgi:hypothetical protein
MEVSKKVKKAIRVSMFVLLLLSLCAVGAQAQHEYWRVPDGYPVEIHGGVVALESYYSDLDLSDFSLLETPDRSSGIWLLSEGAVYEGDVVDLVGIMTTAADGRRMIIPESGQIVDSGYPLPNRLGLSASKLKSGPFEKLVSTWGTVTAVDPAAYPVCNSYTLDGIATIFDRYNPLPAIGEFKIATGALTTLIDSAGNKSDVVYATYPSHDYNNPRGPDSHTLYGDVFVDYLAGGQTVKIETDSGITSCVLDWMGHGTFELSLPSGYYTVSAEIPGYSTCTYWADLSDDDSEVVLDWFTPLRIMVLAPTFTRVGIGTALLTGWCHDAELRKMAGIDIPWSSDDGQHGEVLTDAEGNFSLTLNASTRRVLNVNIGNAATAFVQVANPTDPYLYITAPENGDHVSGLVPVTVVCKDAVNTEMGYTIKRKLLVDDKPFSHFSADPRDVDTIDTTKLSNRKHKLTAITLNDQGVQTNSNDVWINVDNDFSESKMSGSDIFADENTVMTFSAKMNHSSSWQVLITNCEDDSMVLQSMGTTSEASISWDGKINGNIACGVYKVTCTGDKTITSETSPVPAEQYCAVSYTYGSALICGVVENQPDDVRTNVVREMSHAAKACKKRGIIVTALIDPPWRTPDDDSGIRGMEYWLQHGVHRTFFLATHGAYIQDWRDGLWRPFITFPDDIVTYVNVATDARTKKMYPAFEDFSGTQNTWNLIDMQCCNSSGDWPDFDGPFGRIANEIRKGFNLVPRNPNGGCMVGWLDGYRSGLFLHIVALSPNGEGWERAFWENLENGASMSEASINASYNLDPTTWGTQSFFLSIIDPESSQVTWLE